MKKEFTLSKKDALIIVDVQNDFCPGGALPIPEGEQVVPVLNDYIALFKKTNAGIFATRDWHPPNHVSFKAQGGRWPPHCVQNTEGAKFHPDLQLPNDTTIVSKAMNPHKEAYSGFDGTKLASKLRTQSRARVFVGGLAIEYCVKQTVLDACKLSFKALLLSDAIASINTKPSNIAKAIDEMIEGGAEQATLLDFIDAFEIPPSGDPINESLYDKPLSKFETKKKARMRSRGPYKKIRAERG